MWRTPASRYDWITASISALVAATQVRCAAGVSAVSVTIRRTVEWVRSRVEPPAP